jgi:hypothetical protein
MEKKTYGKTADDMEGQHQERHLVATEYKRNEEVSRGQEHLKAN